MVSTCTCKGDPKKLVDIAKGEELEDNLIRMDCNGLYEKLWNVKA